MEKTRLWILKFTKDGGVYASEEPPSLVLLSAGELPRGDAGATSSRQPHQPSKVGDFVLAGGKRAQIRNIFISHSRGSLAQLFFIDTAEDGTAPVHQLSPVPEGLMEDPPLAQYFTLAGLTPHIPKEPSETSSRVKQALNKCVGRVTSFQPQMWPSFAMNILKMIAGCPGDLGEVKVRADMWPGGEIVVYCDTTEGALNFNQYLIAVNFAVVRQQSPKLSSSSPHFPSPEQLMSALENINKLQFDIPGSSETTPSRPVRPVRKTSSKPVTREIEEEPIPYTYLKVYVESPLKTKPSVSLDGAGFPGSVCKVLTRLGFQTPTLAQGASWPILGKERSLTIIVSPPNSGKTLAYLLPLVTKREVSHRKDGVPHPRLIVVVRSSWGALAVHTRAVELMSAQSAHRRFRSCAAYKAQGTATVQILSGVEVLLCTPDCLLQLIEKTVAQLDSLAYLVLDDFEMLQKSFSTEISKILALCSSSTCSGPVGVVVTTSQWSEAVAAVPALISDHTHLCSSPAHLVIACPIEATIRARVKMSVILCLEISPESILPKQLSLMDHRSSTTVICVATTETANGLLRNLHRQCLSVAMVKEGERRNVKELFKRHSIVVVTDGAMPVLIQTGPLISTVIHYELPINRTAFTNRLTLLYPAIHRGVLCSHAILLTERWSRQAAILTEMMTRMNQAPPQPLLDMADKLVKEREERRKDHDLCYNLKAWGLCLDALCSYRHVHTTSPSSFPSPQAVELPRDGSIKVMVKYVSTATRWWVSLLGHAPLYRGAEPVKPHDPNGLLKMLFRLAEYFTPERQRNTLHSVPAEGNYCALRDHDGSFFRVRILKFSQPLRFMFHHKERALVRLIDVGEARIVDVSQLLELPRHLLAPPANVFEIFVCRVKPSDSDPDWPPQAAEMMEREYRNQTVHGRVALVSGETVWVHPIEKKVHHKVSNIVAALTSPQKQLKDAKMAENNPQHLVNLANRLGLPLIRAENIVTIDDPCVSFASLKNKEGSYVEVCVSAVDSPNRFYLQPMATESRVIELENSLNQYDGVCSMVVQPLSVGSVCTAQFSENKSWYRGCVLEVEGHESKIRFLDYGNVEWVMNHLVQPIHPSLLELPFQAICASFGMDDTEWGTEAGTLLYEWTRELVLIAKVKSVAPSSSKLLRGPECATVELFETSSNCSGRLGTNVALRLPGAQSHTAEPLPLKPVRQEVNPAFENICLTLSEDQPLDEREDVAMAIRNAVFNKPGLCVSESVLELLCQVVCDTPPSVSTPLLETLRVLSTFHTKVGIKLSSDSCLSHPLKLLQNTSSQAVMSETLSLLVHLLKHTTSSSVLLTEVTMEIMMGVFRDHGNHRIARERQDILKPLISILYHITTSRPQLLQLAISQGMVPLLCSWLLTASNLPQISYHRCLVNHVLSLLVGVAKLPLHRRSVSDSLSLDNLNTHLLSYDEFAHPVLRLLVPLSVLPEFASKLYSNLLLKTIYKLTVTSATTRVLLCSLKLNLKHVETKLKQTVNGDAHIISSVKECSTTCYKEKGRVRSPLSKGRIKPTITRTSRTTALRPQVLWSQREETVLLAIQLRGCSVKDASSNFTQTAVKFITSIWDQDYQFYVELFAPVKPEACSMTVTGSEVLLKLVKAVSGVWPRLTHGNQKPRHISIDFNRWEDKEFGVLGANDWSVAPRNSYINPVLTDLDLTESGSEEDRDEEEEEEEGKQAWQDDLDLGFGD